LCSAGSVSVPAKQTLGVLSQGKPTEYDVFCRLMTIHCERMAVKKNRASFELLNSQ
jgi:hypothetical protein